MSNVAKALPAPLQTPDGLTQTSAANDGQLMCQYCCDCATWRYMPTIVCPQCASQAFEWRVCEGAGTVYSFTVVHRAPSDAFSAHTPFVVALIDLKEGPRVMTNIIGDDRFEVAIGDSVRVCFEPREEATVPQFRRQATAP